MAVTTSWRKETVKLLVPRHYHCRPAVAATIIITVASAVATAVATITTAAAAAAAA